ncbi:MAG: hypothetical protein JO156_04465, partial [Solirubrobacterales bacterium]|nr:hypothetical protein [Solirubrobacterales bacterium]
MSRGIRATAWAVLAVGVAAPVLRRWIKLAPAVVLASAATAPLGAA